MIAAVHTFNGAGLFFTAELFIVTYGADGKSADTEGR